MGHFLFILCFAFLFLTGAKLNAQNTEDELTFYGGVKKDCGSVTFILDQDFSIYKPNLSTTKQCFNHDAAGNLIGSSNCKKTKGIKSASVEDELAEFESTKEEPIDLGDSFVAYPNPTDGLFYLAWNRDDANQLTTIRLVSIGTGQMLPVTFKNSDKLTTIDLSAQPPGLYVLQIVMANGTTKSIKVIRK